MFLQKVLNLNLNTHKCKSVHFNLIKNQINFHYSISDTKIELVSPLNDLDVVFDFKSNFSLHTEVIKNKANL